MTAASREKPVAAVILLREDGAALMQHRDEKPGLRHSGLWAFPGGHCDDGEDPVSCARREFLEETRYRLGELIPLGTVPDRGGPEEYELHLFLARYDQRQSFECHEGQELRFMSRSEARERPVVSFLLPFWDQAIQIMKAEGWAA